MKQAVEKVADEVTIGIYIDRLRKALEGKLQIEGEVIHVIVKHCYDFSKLLRQLTASQTNDPEVLMQSRSNEKSIPPPQNKRSQVHKHIQEIVFPPARNFK